MSSHKDRDFDKLIGDRIDEGTYLQEMLNMSDLGQQFSESRHSLCKVLEEIRQTCNLDRLIDAEAALLIEQADTAINRSPTWPQELQSITLADEQMAKGLRCYNQLTEDVEAYKAETSVHAKRAADKYPQDSFRIFLDAQHARLQNALKMPYTEAEKAVLEARDSNIKTMRRLYKTLQKEKLPEPVMQIGELAKYRAERKAATGSRKAPMLTDQPEKVATNKIRQAPMLSPKNPAPVKPKGPDQDKGPTR